MPRLHRDRRIAGQAFGVAARTHAQEKRGLPRVAVVGASAGGPWRQQDVASIRGKSGEGRTVDTYDYVIIGAGSAGSVLANRLTEDGTATVLVLEAGPSDWHPYIHLPAGFIKTFTTRA